MSEEDKPDCLDGLDGLLNSLQMRQSHGLRAIVGVNGTRSILCESLEESEWEARSLEMHANQSRYEEETEEAAERASESPLERS